MGKKSRRRPQQTSNASAAAASSNNNHGGNDAASSTSTRRAQLQARRHCQRDEDGPVSIRNLADDMIQLFAHMSAVGVDPWSETRLSVLALYSRCMQQGRMELGFYTMQDWNFLGKIRKSKSEPNFFRFVALKCTGYMCLLMNHDGLFRIDDSFMFFDQANELIESTSQEEKLRLVNMDGPDEKFITIGDYMVLQRQEWLDFVDSLARAGAFLMRDGSNPAIIGGSVCSQCEKTRRELGLSALLVCARCQLTYFCSDACQRVAWKEHKKVCRRPGEFKPGDLALSREHVGGINRGDSVRIVSSAKAENDMECWTVLSHEDESKQAIIPAKRLKRVRPDFFE